MADYLKRNMQALYKHNPVMMNNWKHFEHLLTKDMDKVGEAVCYKNKCLYFKWEEEWLHLTGQNPRQEAVFLTTEIEPRKEHLILVFGMANIELLNWLENNTIEGTKIAVFEPNLQVMQYCLKNYNLSSYIESPKFGFILGDDELYQRQILIYFSGSWENLVQNLLVISNPNYYMYQEFQMETIKLIGQKIDHILKCMGNSLGDMIRGLENHFWNIDACIKANPCEEIKDKYTGYPAIIVASGPSLDKNIDDLKEAQGKALIIACDASYRVCMEHEIIPDMIVSLEREIPTYEAFYKNRTFHKELVLAGPSLLWPQIHEEFPGKQILFTKNNIGQEGWWMKLFPKFVYVDMGHSCATAACGIARYAGCRTVILVGQDLAYTDEKKHSDRVREDSFKDSNELSESEKAKDNLWVEDIHGNMVRTSEVFNLFRSYFENTTLKPGILIDATEGGALIHGTKIMKLKEAISNYCTEKIPFELNDVLSDIEVTSEIKKKTYENILKETEILLEAVRKIQDFTTAYYNKIKKYAEFDFANADKETLYAIVEELQEGNSILDLIRTENTDIVTYYQHILKYTVIYVKKIGNELTAETVKRNWELQQNLMRMIDVTSVAVGNKLLELMNEVEEKMERVGVDDKQD